MFRQSCKALKQPFRQSCEGLKPGFHRTIGELWFFVFGPFPVQIVDTYGILFFVNNLGKWSFCETLLEAIIPGLVGTITKLQAISKGWRESFFYKRSLKGVSNHLKASSDHSRHEASIPRLQAIDQGSKELFKAWRNQADCKQWLKAGSTCPNPSSKLPRLRAIIQRREPIIQA